MTYYCGVGPGIPGIAAREPSIVCDACGAKHVITTRGAPPRWLLDGKAPRGWLAIERPQGKREHRCRACR